MQEKIHILHLEDDPIDAELVHAALESMDLPFQVTRVQTSGEFTQALHTEGYDLILADYSLPTYDGISALRFAQKEYPDIPFIFVSGTLGEDAAIEGLIHGATDYVLKNKLARLAPALKRALGEAENQIKRKEAEESLRASEERYRTLVEQASDGIFIADPTGRYIDVNPSGCSMLGYTKEEILKLNMQDLVAPDDQAKTPIKFHELKAGQIVLSERTMLTKSGARLPVEISGKMLDDGRLQGIVRDITERKQHEHEREAIIAVANAIRTATTRAEILTIILDQLNDLFGAEGAIMATLDDTGEETLLEEGRGPVGARFTGLRLPPGKGISRSVILEKKTYLHNDVLVDPRFFHFELLGDAHAMAAVPLTAQDQAIGALWIIRRNEITEADVRLLNAIADLTANAIQRVTLYEQTERQLHHLIALHQIDIAISASLDLDVTLNVFLNNVIAQLGVDAADILLLSLPSQRLTYGAGIGFWTRQIEQSKIALGEGQAGQAADQRRIIAFPDLEKSGERFTRLTLLADEKFVSHYVAPLTAKGQLKGVLEVFTRRRLDASREWLDFFETLAVQAAIAIDNATLFENLQRSNIELRLAYDATIEGWSHALDMRDRETEGHSQRVAEMTLQLAERMGINNGEQLDLRRGALLHDIGKMGIPDAILLKPGSLTDTEWEIMRQHPLYAYEMLSPITYLRHAVDIPYCHHEKWDGSGYPRGLAGNQIPLSARIFAIADVFDALTSTRPYRPARPKAEAYQYILEQAGRHFDPAVVKAFIKLQQNNEGIPGATSS